MPTIPRPSRSTVREFGFQLVTIITGILIALWVDSLVEARRERALVRDAHAAISREMADNLRELSGSLPALDEHERSLRIGLRFTDDLRKRGKTDIDTLRFGISMPSLNRASWQSAERTGALGYMAFADVKAYAEIYELQDLVMAGQRQQLARISDVTALVYGGENDDPTRLRGAELQSLRARILDALGGATIHKTLATELVKAYKEAPKR
jgi:hypothetical protein